MSKDIDPNVIKKKISIEVLWNQLIYSKYKQNVRIEANSETLEALITEVKDRTLNIRFPNKNMFKKWDPGKIEIYISVPDIDGLNVSGSGDIISEQINSRILDLVVSGSGNIEIEKLKSRKFFN